MNRGTARGRAWAGLALLLCLCSIAGYALSQDTRASIDWQPALASNQPWRAFSAVAVHYSTLHLFANLAGALAVGVLGIAARSSAASTIAWALAWPLTQLGLAFEPRLLHYGGLSGVLHAGVAVIAVQLLMRPSRGAQRWVGAALLFGLGAKVFLEAPWAEPLRYPAGWDIAVAPFAHLSGLVAGLVCALFCMLAAHLLTARALPRSDEHHV